MSKPTLTEIFKEIGNFGQHTGYNDKGGLHTYLDTYERLFSPFRNGCVFMEIGLAKGDSLRMWDEYFEDSKIIGVDISIDFPQEQYKNDVTILEIDATNTNLLKCLEGIELSLVVEDSTHVVEDQVDIFNLLKHKMKKGSIYIIEDIKNIDESRSVFESLHHNCEIVDMRTASIPDNCLVIYKF